MRLLTLALAGLLAATLPALASPSNKAGRTPAKAAHAAPAAKATASKTQLAAHRGGPHRRATLVSAPCGGRRGAACHATPRLGGWANGLTPAVGLQAQACPDGTMSTLAHGHQDVVRCMPI
jgi:hypothetical protein